MRLRSPIFDPRLFTREFQILRDLAQHGPGEHLGARADAGQAGDHDMAAQFHPVAQRDIGPDMAERADPDIGADPGAFLDHGAGVNVAHRVSLT